MTTDERLKFRSESRLIGRRAPRRVFAVCVLTAVLATSAAGKAARAASAADAAKSQDAFLERQLDALRRRTEETPKNGAGWKELGSAYVRRAYETADPSYYPAAADAFKRASALVPKSPELLAAEAGLALARHEFAVAASLSRDALTLQPNSFDAKVALVDATIELGRYDEAAGLIDGLVDQRAGVASLSRLSYLRQLNGDIVGAEAAMRSAISAAPAGTVDRSVALAYLGDILLERGKGSAARKAFDEARRIHPFSATAAMGIARMDAGDRRWGASIAVLDALTERVPLPGALGQRADVARAAHDPKGELAANQLVDASIALFRSNGAVVDSELAVLLADRGPGSAASAVSAAKKAYASRQTIFTNDAMAWSLFQAGKVTDAVPFARRAVATNPAVASVRWHAAAVFAAAGFNDDARSELAAASVNQWFSASQNSARVALAIKLKGQS